MPHPAQLFWVEQPHSAITTPTFNKAVSMAESLGGQGFQPSARSARDKNVAGTDP